MAAPRTDRKLAAIMAVDVVGYSRMVGADEAGTLARVKTHRVEFVEPLIADYHGRVVKLTGDGALVEFASAVDAVECAVAIQGGMAEREAAEPEERRIRFRIGINIGDIVLEDGDIFGDGVNVAARLEGLAEPGGICIARNVYNQVKSKLHLGFEPMGEHQVKNIAEPVEVYRVLAEPGAVTKAIGLKRVGTPGWRWAAFAAAIAVVVIAAGGLSWRYAGQPGLQAISDAASDGAAEAKPALPLPDKPSIAVLPFDNLSGEERYERLADGLTEDIITDLSRFRDLFVIARNSTFAYKDKSTDVRQIARELGVQYVLEGSLQAEGDRVRITAQLIDASTGNHVWSERYDSPLDDVFAIQDEVAQTVVASVPGQHGVLARARRETARRKPPKNLQAYDYFALGIEQKHLFTKESNRKAQELFRKAREVDPNYARAYYGLAMSYGMDADFGWGESWQESMDKWGAALSKATALDPYDSSPHMEFAFYYARLGDLDRALAELEESLQLNPNDADALAIAAFILVRAGQPERARESVERAMRLNPHHPDWYYAPAREAYFFTKGFAETIAALKKRKHPSPMLDPLFLSLSYAQVGRDQEAAESVKQLFADEVDWSAEKFLSDTGTFARDEELNLFLDSVEKAALPLCATEEQLAKYPDMKRLDLCEQRRASG